LIIPIRKQIFVLLLFSVSFFFFFSRISLCQFAVLFYFFFWRSDDGGENSGFGLFFEFLSLNIILKECRDVFRINFEKIQGFAKRCHLHWKLLGDGTVLRNAGIFVEICDGRCGRFFGTIFEVSAKTQI
jgi:hypothetical protein